MKLTLLGALYSSRLRPGLLYCVCGLLPRTGDGCTAEALDLFVPLERRDRTSGIRKSMRSRLMWNMPK